MEPEEQEVKIAEETFAAKETYEQLKQENIDKMTVADKYYLFGIE